MGLHLVFLKKLEVRARKLKEILAEGTAGLLKSEEEFKEFQQALQALH